MEHSQDAGFLSFRMQIEDEMMFAMADEHVWIGWRERARGDAPLRKSPESSLQQARIAPLLACAPLPQRIPGDFSQVTLSLRR